MQRQDFLQKFGPVKVMQAIDDVADFVGDTDEIGSSDVSGWIKQVERSLGGVDEGMLDTVKKVGSKVFDKLGGGSEEDLLKDLQKKAGIPSHAQHGKPNMAKPNEKEVDESALQAYLGDKKYGKDGMDALRKAGQEHASEKTMQNIRAKFSDKEKEVEEGFVGNMINKAKGMFTKPGQPAAAPATAAPVVPDAATKARIAAAPQGYDPNTGKPQVAMGLRPGVVKKGGTMDMTKKVVAPAAKPAAAPAQAAAPAPGGVQGIKSNVDINTLQKFNGIVDVPPKIKPQIKDAKGRTWTKLTGGWTQDGSDRTIDRQDSTYQSFDDAWRVANGAQPGNVGVPGAQQPAVAESKDDALLARIKSLALIK
jgi:hypothetical protein